MYSNPILRKFLLLFGVILAIMIISFTTWKRANSWDFPPSTATPDPFVTYDPATYGIPDTIAGYKVQAVQTLENTACMLPNAMRLILQSIQSDFDSFLASSNPQAVLDELAKLDLPKDVKWELVFDGPGLWDREEFISGNAEWNSVRGNNGFRCLKSGPAIIITSTPVE